LISPCWLKKYDAPALTFDALTAGARGAPLCLAARLAESMHCARAQVRHSRMRVIARRPLASVVIRRARGRTSTTAPIITSTG